ncbi:MAG TPA: hypothetical protein VI749_02605 [Candidatus Omnitrophota bacterium]|nr:hypothetical protein [Candidatus Omnitrophota bacterium]
MKEFFVGLLVLLMLLFLSVVGVFLLPFIVVLGFFLKWLITVALFIFAIWLLGATTLWVMGKVKEKGK